MAVAFALVAGLPACIDPTGPAPPTGEPELATAAPTSLAAVKLSSTGIIVTEFPVHLGCRALEGTVFIPDVTGQTHGTTVTISDCHWNATAERCDCTISATQH